MAARIKLEEYIPLMAEHSLREAIAVGKQRIDQGRAREAVLLAQALLAQYPHYLSAYYLLAEAALDLGYNRDALEIFQRILSADPESITAHVSLAAIYADAGAVDEALWHMMRAFEVQPGVREVREQLRALYERRDGRSPGRLPLNHAALARTYIANGWYERAEEEIAAELTGETERMDLRAALVGAQWHAGRRLEAVATAQALLEELPLCLKAHLVLSAFFAQEGTLDEATPYLHTVEQLDPEHEFAVQFLGADTSLQPRSIAFSFEESTHGPDVVNRLPEWVTELQLCYDIPLAPTSSGSATPETAEQSGEATSPTIRATEEAEWQRLLYAETQHALDAYAALRDGSPDWRASLYQATRTVVEARMPSWLATLRDATARLLTTVPALQPISTERATDHLLTWVARLRADTQEALSTTSQDAAGAVPLAVEQPTLADVREEGTVAQEQEEDAHVGTLLDSESGQLGEVPPEHWVERLRADSESVFVSPDEEAASLEQVEEPTVEETGALQTTLDVATVGEEEVFAPAAQVEEETGPTLVEHGDERLPDEAPGNVPPEVVVEEAEVAPTVPGEEASQEPVLEAEEPSPRLEEAAIPAWDDEVAVGEDPVRTLQDEVDTAERSVTQIAESDAAPDAMGDVEEPDAVSDDLLLAYRYRENGNIAEALAIYQRLAEEGAVEYETLLQVLMVWLAMGGAPPLAYRLVGDLHRRRGRLQDALAYYREAIQRS